MVLFESIVKQSPSKIKHIPIRIVAYRGLDIEYNARMTPITPIKIIIIEATFDSVGSRTTPKIPTRIIKIAIM